ncbi:MAG: hypothetical protein NT150_08475 [Bacteroidetes bacterium]|nr:hypothetical protein [Bacteroidota bacterium]
MNIRQILPVIAASAIVLFTGCPGTGDGDTPPGKGGDSIKTPPIGEFGGKIFSIPSPIELSLLIKESGLAFDAEILNKDSKVDQYTTTTQRALNLGIYGADLGYTSIYERPDASLKYMRSVRKLSDQLGITDAFDNSTIERVEKNIENKDSLLLLVSTAYRDCDDYLKRNDMQNVGALIITGGWIESVYFAVQVSSAKPNKNVMKRVAEQKLALSNLLEMLVPHLTEPGVEDVHTKLSELEELYQGVTINYTFVKPETDKVNKITTIKSKSEPVISEETFKAIAAKITALRNQIVE